MQTLNAPVQRPTSFGDRMRKAPLLPGKSHRFTGNAILLFTLLAQAAHAAPKLEVDRHTFNAGIQSPTNLVHHVFHLKNTGDEELLFLKVQDSCAGRFAEVRLEKDKLVPGETTSLYAVMRMNPGDESFLQTGTILLTTNEPEGSPRHGLRIMGTARSGLRLSAGTIDLGNIAAGSPIETSVKLESTTEKTWRLLEVKSIKGLSRTRVQTSEDGRLHNVFITLTPQEQASSLILERILLSTDNPDCPIAMVQIVGTRVDPDQVPQRESPAKNP